jgi:hypothetical protein
MNFKISSSSVLMIRRGLITDQYGLGSEWGNSIAALRWNHLLRPNLFTNTTLRFSRFFYQSQLTFVSTFLNTTGRENLLANYGQFYQTLIQDWSGKTDFSYYPTERLILRWGISYTLHTFQPGALSVNFLVPGQSPLTVDSLSKVLLNNERLGADEAEFYAASDWQFWKHWHLEAGLNFSAFQIRNTRNGALLPRVRLLRSGKQGWSQWAGYHRSAQFLHQIGTFNISLPFELWVPSTAKVPSELAWQVSSGFGWQRNGWRFSAEGYYKRLQRVLTFLSSNTALFAGGAEDASGWEDRIAVGHGTGYGVELLLEKATKPVTVTLTYALSKAERQFSGPEFGAPVSFSIRPAARPENRGTAAPDALVGCQCRMGFCYRKSYYPGRGEISTPHAKRRHRTNRLCLYRGEWLPASGLSPPGFGIKCAFQRRPGATRDPVGSV